jgi:hypothetical protein
MTWNRLASKPPTQALNDNSTTFLHSEEEKMVAPGSDIAKEPCIGKDLGALRKDQNFDLVHPFFRSESHDPALKLQFLYPSRWTRFISHLGEKIGTRADLHILHCPDHRLIVLEDRNHLALAGFILDSSLSPSISKSARPQTRSGTIH